MRQPSKYDDFWGWVGAPTQSGCRLWRGRVNHDGYGQFSEWRGVADQRTVRAHVRAYELRHGKVPRGRKVLHTCDVRACCADEHLYVGTQAQNVRDSVVRLRHRSGNQRLEPEHAVMICTLRRRGWPTRDIARFFRVRAGHVQAIVGGRRHARALVAAVRVKLEELDQEAARA